MILLRTLLTLTVVAMVSLWTLKERPELLYTLLTSETVSELFSFPTAEPVVAEPVPGLSLPSIPFLSESRSLSATFQPILREYAPRLSVPTAHASVIMDANSGKVLYDRNADDRRQIASLTKLFTALIVVERVPNLDEVLVTIDEEAIYSEGTRIGCPRSGYCPGVRFAIGEKLTVHSLLKAALMQSANDAAIALGKHIGGSQEGFATIMNARAKELGLTDSLFCTPSGLEIDGAENRCYSSAHDIAIIASEALKHPILWDIMKIEKTNIVSADGTLTHEVFNTDQLIGTMPNLVGTKTGFTPLAGYSLLAVATDPSGEHPVIAVVLNDPYRWESIQSMFDWSFESFDWI